VTIAEDASTPAVLQVATGTTGTGTTASFSPPAGSLVVVTVVVAYASNSAGTTGASTPLSCADSLSNSYALGVFVNPYVPSGSFLFNTAIFTYYYASAPGSVTVTVTNSNTSSADLDVCARVLTGAAASQAGAATAALNGALTETSPQPSGSITTTTTGSWVYVAGGIGSYDGPVVLSGTTQIDYRTGLNRTLVAGRKTAATVTPGAVTVGWTTGFSEIPQWAALEILPPSSGGGYSSYPYGTPHSGSEGNTFTGTDTNANVGEPNALGVLPLGTPHGLA
jgi:hypothetical protein